MNAAMNKKEIADLIKRAEQVIGNQMPVTILAGIEAQTVSCSFVKIGKPYYLGEVKNLKNFLIDGILEAPDGSHFPVPLRKIVVYFETRSNLNTKLHH